ncbi:MAG: VOC family protein [Tateyamaria sp.]
MARDFIEIGTDDIAAARAFYEGVFGWRWVAMGEGPQGYFSDGARQVGLHGGDTPCVVPYLQVTRIEEMVARVTARGGALTGAITEAPGLGRFATCTDPRGARFGLHQPD